MFSLYDSSLLVLKCGVSTGTEYVLVTQLIISNLKVNTANSLISDPKKSDV